MMYLSKKDVEKSWNEAVVNDNVISIKRLSWWRRAMIFLRLMKRPQTYGWHVTKNRR